MKNIFIMVMLIFSSFSLADSERSIEMAVEKAVQDNIRYMKEKDIAKAMNTIHPESVSYEATLEVIEQLLNIYDLKYTIKNYKFIAFDDGLAYARVLLLTEKISGPQFSDNEIDMLMIFKQHDGIWKLWSQANMEVRYL